MNWLCWHVGTVTDPKFSVISRISGAPKTAVICVWAALLEHAKQNDGCVAAFDEEAAAELLGIDQDHVGIVVEGFESRGMIDADRKIANWDKRQHQKSTQRVKEFRARMKRDETHETVSPVSRNAETHETGQTDRQTDTQTDRQTTTHYAASDLSERVEAALCQDMPVFGLTAACDMLMGEGFTESDLLDAARSIAARGKRRVNPNYFIQAARGMKDDASRPTPAQSPRKPRYNPADASSPDAVAERRSKIAAGMREAFPGLGGAGDPGTGG